MFPTKSVTIESELLGYWTPRGENREAYQRLTINDRGSVFFTGWNYNRKKLRTRNMNIGKEKACKILSLINKYTTRREFEWYAMDVGSFVLWEKDIYGERFKTDGMMVGEVAIDGVNIGKFIQENVPIYGLNPFGNDTEEVYFADMILEI